MSRRVVTISCPTGGGGPVLRAEGRSLDPRPDAWVGADAQEHLVCHGPSQPRGDKGTAVTGALMSQTERARGGRWPSMAVR